MLLVQEWLLYCVLKSWLIGFFIEGKYSKFLFRGRTFGTISWSYSDIAFVSWLLQGDIWCVGWQNSGVQSRDGKDTTILGGIFFLLFVWCFSFLYWDSVRRTIISNQVKYTKQRRKKVRLTWKYQEIQPHGGKKINYHPLPRYLMRKRKQKRNS